jgi:glycosyltransferase involved in cell wall biosynthesis
VLVVAVAPSAYREGQASCLEQALGVEVRLEYLYDAADAWAPAGALGRPVSDRGTARVPLAVRSFRRARQIAQQLEDHPSAVMLCGYVDLEFQYLAHTCRQVGIPHVLFTDSNLLGEEHVVGAKRLLKRALISSVLRGATAVAVPGGLGELYYRSYDVRLPFVYIPHEPAGPGGRSLSRQTPPDAMRVLYVGRLAPEKHLEDLLLAADAVVRQAPGDRPVSVTIAGAGPESARLREMANSAAVPVRLEGPLLTPSAVEQAMVDHDVFVHPAAVEPWGVGILEALDCGLPVVATFGAGAASEVYADPVSAELLYEPRDIRGLTALLQRCTDSDWLAARRSAALSAYAIWRSQGGAAAGWSQVLRRVGVR